MYGFRSYKSSEHIQLPMSLDMQRFTVCGNVYVTIFGKIDHLRASTEIHFLPVRESYIHALSRNTKYLTIDGQVCFYRQPFADAVEPRGCISWP